MMEGGGQLLRMAITYSAVLQKPIRVSKIRAKRSSPGLRPQHKATLMAAAEICNAKVRGVQIGSKEIEFIPGKIHGGAYKFDIGTAGSISLFLQCITPIAAYAEKPLQVTIKGGTAVRWSPTIPFVEHVVWRAFSRMGLKTEIITRRHGFFPKGGGIVEAGFHPITRFDSYNGKRDLQITVKGVSISGRLPRHVAERQKQSAEIILRGAGFESEIKVVHLEGKNQPSSPGSAICLWVDSEMMSIGSDSLGERGKPAENVGREAALCLIDHVKTGAQTDFHTADHLILPCSLAKGSSSFTTSKITLHMLAAIELAGLFSDAEFSVEGEIGDRGKISCLGVGFSGV